MPVPYYHTLCQYHITIRYSSTIPPYAMPVTPCDIAVPHHHTPDQYYITRRPIPRTVSQYRES
eukprot:1707445-Rhodomonas_salina.3